jgi:hypothetical protein
MTGEMPWGCRRESMGVPEMLPDGDKGCGRGPEVTVPGAGQDAAGGGGKQGYRLEKEERGGQTSVCSSMASWYIQSRRRLQEVMTHSRSQQMQGMSSPPARMSEGFMDFFTARRV